MTEFAIPTFDKMMNPTLRALHKLGRSATVNEIYEIVIQDMALRDEQLEVVHDPTKSNQTEVAYRLAWTRTYLKKVGLINNSKRGVWALTADGIARQNVIPREIVLLVRQMDKDAKEQYKDESDLESEDENGGRTWRQMLNSILLDLDPAGFERLFQRILRESGFTQVEVTGRSGDGGIDGIGIIRVGGFLSFRVLFQCKRWKGSVSASTVRDFRGAMIGRTDKGLIVTTGNFTRDAVREATRDGAPEIDLIDGEQLIDKLRELSLGVKTEEVITEHVTVDPDFFNSI